MSSKETQVMTAVSSVLSFIKERLTADMKEAADKKMFNVDSSDLNRICEVAKSSIDASFFKSASEIENAVK
jgi:hypothetical protein